MSINQRDLENLINRTISKRLLQYSYGRGAGPSLQTFLERLAASAGAPDGEEA